MLKNIKKGSKGITLIALIITIIVMLILVGVTINVALNGGLFTKASQASKQMQVEADRETLLSAVVAAIGYDGKVVLADIELPAGWSGSNGTYISPKGNTFSVDENGKITGGGSGNNSGGGNAGGSTTALHDYEINGDVIKCNKHEDETYTIGESFSYTPSNEIESVTITGDRSGVSAGIAAGKLETSNYETGGNQTITRDETLTWVVFGISEDKNKLLITSSTPTLSAVTLYGRQSYNNGPEIVNEICGMYSGENATAEGMTIEDVNTILGFTPSGSGFCHNGDEYIWVTGTVADTVNVPYYKNSSINIWSRIQEDATEAYNEGKTIIPEGNKGSLEATLTALGNYPINGYYYESDGTTATDARKNVVFGANNDIFYLLASRGVYAYSSHVNFGPGAVIEGLVYSFGVLFYSDGDGDVGTVPVRPVVSIIPTV